MGSLCCKTKSSSQGRYGNNTGEFSHLEIGAEIGNQWSDPMDGHGAGHHVERSSPAIHSEAVTSLARVQQGLCLSGSKDQTLCLYNYKNKRLEEKWDGHEKEVTKVWYGELCQGFFSASRDKYVKMWKRGTSQPVREFIGHDLVVTALHGNNDNTTLCTGSRDNTVRLWDIETATSIAENNIHRNLVTDVKFVPNSNIIVQTGEDKEVRLFDHRTLGVVHSFQRKQYIQMCVDVTPNGDYCLTCSNGFGGNGCEATLWDLRSRSIVHEFKGHTEAIDSCLFLPYCDGKLLATASRDCSVKIWDRDSRACICECVISGSGPLTSLIAYEDQSILVSTFNLGIQHLQFSTLSQTLRNVGSF